MTEDDNLSNVSHYSSAEEEMISSFKNLVINTSGNLRCIQAFQDIINDELDKLSRESELGDSSDKTLPNLSSSTTGTANSNSEHDVDIYLNPVSSDPKHLVVDFPHFIDHDFISDSGLFLNVKRAFNDYHHHQKYLWLNDMGINYSFGKSTYVPDPLSKHPGVLNLRDKINEVFKLEFDSCLIIRYKDKTKSLSLHQDNEPIFDQEYPIFCVSLGYPSTVEFWDAKNESTGNLVKKVEAQEGSLYIMLPGCQEKLWHKTPRPVKSPKKDDVRFAISFRKLRVPGQSPKKPPTPNTPCPGSNVAKSQPALAPNFDLGNAVTSTPCVKKNTHDLDHAPPMSSRTEAPPFPPLSSLPNGFIVHPDRLNVPVHRLPPPLPEQHGNAQGYMPFPAPTSPPFRPPPPPSFPQHSLRPMLPPPSHKQAQHLVIGDSMVKGLQLPNTVYICKGGIHPSEVLQLLPSSCSVLSPDQYDAIKSVTLVVGTNALNVPKSGKRDKATTNCTSCESTEGALKVLESSILRLQEEMNKQKVNMEHLAKKLLEHQNNKDRQDQLRSKSKDDVNSIKKSFEDKTKTIFDTINVQQTCLDQITDSITKNERTVAKLKNRIESTETSNQKTHDQYKNELLVIRESLQNSEKNNAEIRKQLEASTQIHQPFESNSTRKSQTPRSDNLINQKQTPESAHMSMLLFILSAVWNENQELKKKVMDSNRKQDTTKNEMQRTYIPMDFLIEEEEIEANTRVERLDRRIRKQNPVNSDSKEVKATQPTNMSRAAQNLKPPTPKAAYKVEKDNKSTKTKKGLLDTPKNQPSISSKPDKVNPTSVAPNRDFPVPTATTRDNYSARETKKGLLATPNSAVI
ncbi:hypothetical protein ACHWQZ_G017202 [Mnemiopsis leidyi]